MKNDLKRNGMNYEQRNETPTKHQSRQVDAPVMCTLTVKWHYFKFWLQWVKFYLFHIKGTTKTHVWAIKNGCSLPIRDHIKFYKWNSWAEYKSRSSYMFHKGNMTYMIRADQIKNSKSILCT